jgi:hypothetical protein
MPAAARPATSAPPHEHGVCGEGPHVQWLAAGECQVRLQLAQHCAAGRRCKAGSREHICHQQWACSSKGWQAVRGGGQQQQAASAANQGSGHEWLRVLSAWCSRGTQCVLLATRDLRGVLSVQAPEAIRRTVCAAGRVFKALDMEAQHGGKPPHAQLLDRGLPPFAVAAHPGLQRRGVRSSGHHIWPCNCADTNREQLPE